LAHHQYFENHGTLPNIEAKIHFPPQRMVPLWFLIYKLYTWKLNHGQTIRDEKRGAISNILRNTLGNWDTIQEPDGKSLGTHWRPPQKKIAPSNPKPKRKKKAPLRLLNWLHEISISKMVCHHLFIYFGTDEKFIHCLVTIFNRD